MPNDEYRCAKFHRKFPLTLSMEQHNSSRVNPEPRTYVGGFWPLPLHDVTSIPPRAHAPALLWYGVKGLSCGFRRLNLLISSIYAQTSSET
jgi:hypothetical protein